MHPLDRIIQHLPLDFFVNLEDETNAAWSAAYKLTTHIYEAPEQANMLGQNRHAFSEMAFRNAAESVQLECHTPHTKPAGGRYSIVKSNDIFILRSNIQAHCGAPKPTVFRQAFSALNEWLDPQQLDLLTVIQKPDELRLCAMIVSTCHADNKDQTIPAFIGLGIPNKDLSSWKSLFSLEEIVAKYHDLGVTVRSKHEAPLVIQDQAMPKLKS